MNVYIVTAVDCDGETTLKAAFDTLEAAQTVVEEHSDEVMEHLEFTSQAFDTDGLTTVFHTLDDHGLVIARVDRVTLNEVPYV